MGLNDKDKEAWRAELERRGLEGLRKYGPKGQQPGQGGGQHCGGGQHKRPATPTLRLVVFYGFLAIPARSSRDFFKPHTVDARTSTVRASRVRYSVDLPAKLTAIASNTPGKT